LTKNLLSISTLDKKGFRVAFIDGEVIMWPKGKTIEDAVVILPKCKVDHEGICKGCVQGKNIKNPFPKSDSKEEGILKLIHSDVCGPMPSTSLRGYAYYVSFVDNYSRKTWVYFLKSKDELLRKVKGIQSLGRKSLRMKNQDTKVR
jgi:hypothetical protein